MKFVEKLKNKKVFALYLLGVLLLSGGISFAYFTSGFNVTGDGSDVTATPGDFMKVVYDAGSEELNTEGMVPGDIATKKFSVTISPTANEKEATYAILLNIHTNTFVKCDDSNYDIATNACIKDEEELIYRLKNESDQVIAEGTLMGVTGELKLITETKTLEVETTYQYTLEIEFVETNVDQNHNANKVLNGSVEVEISNKTLRDQILADNGGTNTIEAKGTPDFSQVATTDEGMYAAEDNDGTSYYYRGAVDNNWVSFAGFYWRIIRINGDGTIRLIYTGEDAGNVTDANRTGETTQIGTSTFNTDYDHSEYVGLKYTEGEQYGVTTDSTIMGVLNTWYISNLTSYASYIDRNAGFCGDRNMASGSLWSSQPSSTIYYAAYGRLNTNKTPSLECSSSDLFTATGANKGNKSLTNPIGLITADDVSYAGGVWGIGNSGYYLYTGQHYWTVSPSYFHPPNTYPAVVFYVASPGGLAAYDVHGMWGVRPVINLRSDVTILSGDGTSSNPYRIEVA